MDAFGFGKLRLVHGPQVVSTFPTRQVEELLGYLLLHQQVEHSREKLISLLWPNQPIHSARSRLSTVLWRLNTVLQGLGLDKRDFLHTSRDTIALRPRTGLTLDLDQYRRCLLEASRASDEDARVAALDAAVSLYAGDLYEGLYADWCLVEREHLARLHLRALGQLMDCHMRERRLEEALAAGEAILRLDPLREEVHRALMRCHWELGRHSLAARQFQQCVTLLADELSAGPAPETVQLYATITEDRFHRLPVARQDDGQSASVTAAFQEFRRAILRFNRLMDTLEAQEGEKSPPTRRADGSPM